MKIIKNIYLIVGESGAGKTTLAKKLGEKYGYTQVLSYTTRLPRCDGEFGHIFIQPDMYTCFDDIRNACRQIKDDIVAETIYNGAFYFATKSQVEAADLYVIDIDGVANYHGSKQYKVIYVRVLPDERKERMLKRGDDPDKVGERMRVDDGMDGSSVADYVVYNADLEHCADMVHQYIKKTEGLF